MRALALTVLALSLTGCSAPGSPADAGSDARPTACTDPGAQPGDVLTFHRDRARLGWDANEPALSPAAVAGTGFGLRWSSPPLDALTLGGITYAPHVYATPLLAHAACVHAAAPIDAATLDLLVVATSNGFVYALAASPGGTAAHPVAAGDIVWRAQLGGASPIMVLDGGVPVGVLATPVIDRRGGAAVVYAAAMDERAGWQVFALDLASGAVRPGWPVVLDPATVEGANRNPPSSFQDPRVLSQRGALNLSPHGDTLYVPFGAYHDGGVGWLVAVDTGTARVRASFSGAPSSALEANGGIWGPGGVSVDDDGTVCATTGNSPVDSHDALHVWGQSLLCWDTDLQLRGTFTPFNYCAMDVADTDLGGSSPVLLPALDAVQSGTARLMAFGGKQGSVYLIDRDHLPGGLEHRPPCSTDSSTDASLLPPGPQPQFGAPGPLNVFGPYSETYGNLDHAKMRSTPAYFRDAAGRDLLFVSGSTKAAVDSMTSVPPSLARLHVVTAPGAPAYLALDGFEQTLAFVNPGSPVVSSDGSAGAVVWVLDENAPRTASLLDPNTPHPILYAVDGETMTTLWQSDASALGVGGKYATVTTAGGTVFVATDRVYAFGIGGM